MSSEDYKIIGQNILSDFKNHDSAGGFELLRVLDSIKDQVTDPVTGNFTELMVGLGLYKREEE